VTIKLSPTDAVKVNNPSSIEDCVKSLLRPYRYRKNKEYYSCSLNFIISSINKCIKFTKDKSYKCNLCETNVVNHSTQHRLYLFFSRLTLKIYKIDITT
jgi:hypothetical protein